MWIAPLGQVPPTDPMGTLRNGLPAPRSGMSPLLNPAPGRDPVVKYKMDQENRAGHRLWRDSI